MPQKMQRVCTCKQCKSARRKGLILGSRIQGYFSQGQFGFGRVSDYVPYHRWLKGRKRKDKPDGQDQQQYS